MFPGQPGMPPPVPSRPPRSGLDLSRAWVRLFVWLYQQLVDAVSEATGFAPGKVTMPARTYMGSRPHQLLLDFCGNLSAGVRKVHVNSPEAVRCSTRDAAGIQAHCRWHRVVLRVQVHHHAAPCDRRCCVSCVSPPCRCILLAGRRCRVAYHRR